MLRDYFTNIVRSFIIVYENLREQDELLSSSTEHNYVGEDKALERLDADHNFLMGD